MTKFGFTYLYTNNLGEMKTFYEEVLTLEKIWDAEEVIAFQIGEHQLSISYDEKYKPSTPKFSKQLGWAGGTEPRTSWSIEYPYEVFWKIIDKCKEQGVVCFNDEPNWVGYWSFPVLDPMNNTIEITCSEKGE